MITAVILAGGLGTRLRSVVPDLPKPMAPVNGRPFLACQMDYWLQQGIQHFVLSVGYRHQSIMDYFGSNYCGSPVEYVVEDTPLGTGGGLLLAVEKLIKESLIMTRNLSIGRPFYSPVVVYYTIILYCSGTEESKQIK